VVYLFISGFVNLTFDSSHLSLLQFSLFTEDFFFETVLRKPLVILLL
jgi:hypothetical protein